MGKICHMSVYCEKVSQEGLGIWNAFFVSVLCDTSVQVYWNVTDRLLSHSAIQPNKSVGISDGKLAEGIVGPNKCKPNEYRVKEHLCCDPGSGSIQPIRSKWAYLSAVVSLVRRVLIIWIFPFAFSIEAWTTYKQPTDEISSVHTALVECSVFALQFWSPIFHNRVSLFEWKGTAYRPNIDSMCMQRTWTHFPKGCFCRESQYSHSSSVCRLHAPYHRHLHHLHHYHTIYSKRVSVAWIWSAIYHCPIKATESAIFHSNSNIRPMKKLLMQQCARTHTVILTVSAQFVSIFPFVNLFAFGIAAVVVVSVVFEFPKIPFYYYPNHCICMYKKIGIEMPEHEGHMRIYTASMGTNISWKYSIKLSACSTIMHVALWKLLAK